MAFYADEEDVWKCPKHPSRRRSIGVCPACLRQKLSVLCPECAMVRPCACCSAASSSSSSSLSLPGDAADFGGTGVGSVGRVSKFIDTEPPFRRSRSVGFPIFKSARFFGAGSVDRKDAQASVEKRKSWFWLFFWPRSSKREKILAVEEEEEAVGWNRTIRRSRSVAASSVSAIAGGVLAEARSMRIKGWYFPSPMKVFRYSRNSRKIVRERSPLHRG